MLKTQLKLARLRDELARQQERQEARKIARRKRHKADQQRRRNAAKANQRAFDSHRPSPMNLANPFRADPDEQDRAGRIRWRLDTANGPEVRTLALWCERIRHETGAAITPIDLEALLRDGTGVGLSDVVRRATEAFLRNSKVFGVRYPSTNEGGP